MNFLFESIVAGAAVGAGLTALTAFRYKASGSALGGLPVHFFTFGILAGLCSWFFRPFGEWAYSSLWLFVVITALFGSLCFLITFLTKIGEKTGADRKAPVLPLRR